jgi:hypothetical protein
LLLTIPIMLTELNEYMFSSIRMNELENVSSEHKPIIKKKTTISMQFGMGSSANVYANANMGAKVDAQPDAIFTPHKRDSLFWCFHIALHGVDNFRFLNNHFIEENTFKIKTVELSRTEKAYLKAFKMKLIMFETQLVNEKQISFNMLQGLCVLYKVNILLVRNRTFLDFCYFPENKTFIVHETKKPNGSTFYSIDNNSSQADIIKVKSELWKQENIDKPLCAISSYKLGDLQNICLRLQLIVKHTTGKNKTKPELYASIIEFLN